MKKHLLTATIFLYLFVSLNAQDTIWFNGTLDEAKKSAGQQNRMLLVFFTQESG